MPGTGKSTIARTVAQRFLETQQLGASIFCSRGPGNSDLNDTRFIFPILSRQLASKHPIFASKFISNSSNDRPRPNGSIVPNTPDYYTYFPFVLIDELMTALRKSSSSLPDTVVTVIDGLDELDEGEGKDSFFDFLKNLLRLASEIPKIKFFVTSRPDSRV